MNTSAGSLARLVGFVVFAVAISPMGHAGPPAGEPGCAAATAGDARWLVDELFRQGEYRRAAACYQAAGDLVSADKAFVRAAKPESDASARDAQQQGIAAKALITQVQRAFRSSR